MVDVMFSLGFFALEGNPRLYEGIVLRLCIVCVFSERETDRETVRENRGYYSGFVVGFVSSIFCWIIERKDWLFEVDVAQTG